LNLDFERQPQEPTVSTPRAPLVIEQIMRDHMERANSFRRAAPARAGRDRSARSPRVRRTLGALVGRAA
jgi:hypothetical protein